MSTLSPEKQLAKLIAKFNPTIAGQIKATRKALRARLPDAYELVYDNYNFLVIGYGPTERPRQAILSITAYARGINVCFLTGAKFKDPKKLLRGEGKIVRNVKLQSADDICSPEFEGFVTQALKIAKWKINKRGANTLIIKSILAKTRPRR